jgi:hypothetical protein
MAHPMGESKDGVLRRDFSRRLKLEFHGSKVTSDAGLLLYRELDDAVESTEIAGDVFTDTRRGKNGCNGLVRRFRQSVFRRLGRYDDVNDADRLSLEPVMRWIDGGHVVMNRTHCGWVGEVPQGPPLPDPLVYLTALRPLLHDVAAQTLRSSLSLSASAKTNGVRLSSKLFRRYLPDGLVPVKE